MSEPSSDRDDTSDPSATPAWDSVRDEFRKACDEGSSPDIQAVLASAPADQREARFHELLAIELKSRRARGEAPTPGEYTTRFPDYSASISRLFAADTLKGAVAETIDAGPAAFGATIDCESPTLTRKSGAGRSASAGRRERPPRQFGDYELQEELARGGMGVVFRARQLSLNRIVALKMILAGQLASQLEVDRFYTEARAAANLDHSGILPIYEINQCDDQHFFTMALVEGGSLSDALQGGPLSAKDAAELLCEVADAVHYAHENGIVHRDLKPANILLDSQGKPKITDFGLAKQVGGDSGMTATGQILGTPSYMPPEQAAGKIAEVDVRSDVYALGAMLYAMLTGHPPFQAETPLEVIQQVLTKDPVPPRKQNPKLPLDLEIICLRCLEKDPRRRLQSAAELRDELTRFLNHEPIESRPVGTLEKAWRWCAKRPLLVGLAASLLFAVAAIGTAAYVYQYAQEATALARASQQFERGLETPYWTPQHLEKMEGYIRELSRLAPERTAEANARVDQQLQSHFDELLRTPNLGPRDRQRLESLVELIALRSPSPDEKRAELRQAISRRLQVWQVAFDLKAPYDNLKQFFPKASVDDKRLILHKKPEASASKSNGDQRKTKAQAEAQAKTQAEAKTKTQTKTPTKTPARKPPRSYAAISTITCDSNVKLEVEFPVGWEKASRLGVLLNAAGDQGYAFAIAAARTAKKSAVVTAKSGSIVARIYRNGVRLAEKTFPVSLLRPGKEALHLTASRQGDQLSFQVNAVEPLTIRDLFPLSSEQPGGFGVYLPREHPVTRVRALRQSIPRSPSPLESGDALYAKGDFREAIQAYQQQAIEAREAKFRYEASYKAGMCLVNLKRFDEAREAFARVVSDADKEWSARAACQLWLIQLRQKREKEADLTLQRLSSVYTFEELAALIPPDDRDQLLRTYQKAIGGGYMATIHNQNRLRNLERLVAVNRVLEVSRGRRYDGRHSLMLEYLRHNQVAAASNLADELIKETWLSPYARWRLLIGCVWVASKTGETNKWIKTINRWLVDEETGKYRADYLPLLIERARLRILDEDWEQAEADAAAAYRLRSQMSKYAHAQIALLHGFLLERKGEREKAEAVWKQGFQEARQAGQARFLGPGMMGSLTGSITTEDTERTIGGVAELGASGPYVSYLRNKFVPLDFARAVLNNMWRQPRGRQVARDIAFRKCGLWESEYLQVPIATSEIWRQCVAGSFEFQGALSPPKEKVIWNVTIRLFKRFREGKYSEGQVLLVALAWKGSMSTLGWRGLAAVLDRDSRAELGYILGCRFAKQLKRFKDARRLFADALKNCAPDSDLAKLIQAEIALLPKKD